ncbi:unnamed protein product [Vitrella brassicaformis CCMP3155]|uniref:RING-type domain-containing protein n=4 Tax=Vitrella brassicaformis TaxID=1169539 RepID=A0A0G4FW84_VITBC|nr:unnamed protein product [Vitrella brassicaformis CCMP3155]|eukprot:CEM19464.1 unnamed protein product [Vitrella brassicaformis CCMP3155]
MASGGGGGGICQSINEELCRLIKDSLLRGATTQEHYESLLSSLPRAKAIISRDLVDERQMATVFGKHSDTVIGRLIDEVADSSVDDSTRAKNIDCLGMAVENPKTNAVFHSDPCRLVAQSSAVLPATAAVIKNRPADMCPLRLRRALAILVVFQETGQGDRLWDVGFIDLLGDVLADEDGRLVCGGECDPLSAATICECTKMILAVDEDARVAGSDALLWGACKILERLAWAAGRLERPDIAKATETVIDVLTGLIWHGEQELPPGQLNPIAAKMIKFDPILELLTTAEGERMGWIDLGLSPKVKSFVTDFVSPYVEKERRVDKARRRLQSGWKDRHKQKNAANGFVQLLGAVNKQTGCREVLRNIYACEYRMTPMRVAAMASTCRTLFDTLCPVNKVAGEPGRQVLMPHFATQLRNDTLIGRTRDVVLSDRSVHNELLSVSIYVPPGDIDFTEASLSVIYSCILDTHRLRRLALTGVRLEDVSDEKGVAFADAIGKLRCLEDLSLRGSNLTPAFTVRLGALLSSSQDRKGRPFRNLRVLRLDWLERTSSVATVVKSLGSRPMDVLDLAEPSLPFNNEDASVDTLQAIGESFAEVRSREIDLSLLVNRDGESVSRFTDALASSMDRNPHKKELKCLAFAYWSSSMIAWALTNPELSIEELRFSSWGGAESVAFLKSSVFANMVFDAHKRAHERREAVLQETRRQKEAQWAAADYETPLPQPVGHGPRPGIPSAAVAAVLRERRRSRWSEALRQREDEARRTPALHIDLRGVNLADEGSSWVELFRTIEAINVQHGYAKTVVSTSPCYRGCTARRDIERALRQCYRHIPPTDDRAVRDLSEAVEEVSSNLMAALRTSFSSLYPYKWHLAFIDKAPTLLELLKTTKGLHIGCTASAKPPFVPVDLDFFGKCICEAGRMFEAFPRPEECFSLLREASKSMASLAAKLGHPTEPDPPISFNAPPANSRADNDQPNTPSEPAADASGPAAVAAVLYEGAYPDEMGCLRRQDETRRRLREKLDRQKKQKAHRQRIEECPAPAEPRGEADGEESREAIMRAEARGREARQALGVQLPGDEVMAELQWQQQKHQQPPPAESKKAKKKRPRQKATGAKRAASADPSPTRWPATPAPAAEQIAAPSHQADQPPDAADAFDAGVCGELDLATPEELVAPGLDALPPSADAPPSNGGGGGGCGGDACPPPLLQTPSGPPSPSPSCIVFQGHRLMDEVEVLAFGDVLVLPPDLMEPLVDPSGSEQPSADEDDDGPMSPDHSEGGESACDGTEGSEQPQIVNPIGSADPLADISSAGKCPLAEQLKQQIATLEERAAEAESTLAALQQRHHIDKSKMVELENNCRSSQVDMKRMRDEIDAHSGVIDRQRKELKSLREQKKSLEDSLRKTKEERDADRQRWEDRVSKQSKAISQRDEEMAALRKRDTDSRARERAVAELEESLRNKEKQLNAHKAKMETELDEEKKSMSTMASQKDAQIKKLQEDMRKLRGEKDAKLKELRAELTQTKTMLKEKTAEAAENSLSQERIRELEGGHEAMVLQLQQLQLDLVQAEQRVAETQEQAQQRVAEAHTRADQMTMPPDVDADRLRQFSDMSDDQLSSQLLGQLLAGERDAKMAKQIHAQRSHEMESLWERLQSCSLRALQRSLQRPGTACGICMDSDRPMSQTFVPCGHRIACTECANSLMSAASPQCPVCRANIQSLQRTIDA